MSFPVKACVYVSALLVLLGGVSCSGGKQERPAQAGQPAASSTRIVTAGSAVNPRDFCSQLKHDGALDAYVDKQGYVVYTVDTKMDQVRPGDASRLAREVLDKAEASGVKLAGCRVVDEFSGQVLAQCRP